jgi:glycine/D-amino acid oxidase-like deaminating enzyme
MIPLPLEVFPPLEPSSLGAPPWDALPPLEAAAAPAQCDIAIVGAGITGLSAALTCARAGREVVVLERAFGTGATARSGGVVLGDTVEGHAPGFNGCERALREWIEQSSADCDLRWRGCLELTRDERLSPAPIDWQDLGAVRLVRRVSGGVLNPAKLQAALLAAAQAAGAIIVNGVTVFNLMSGEKKGVQIALEHGTMTAAAGIMAVDAMCWRPGFDPWWERVMTVSLQTAGLTTDQLETLGLQNDEAFYTVETPLLWGRVMPDQSLVVGRETNPFPRKPDGRQLHDGLREAALRLSERVRGLHPALSQVEVRRAWTGPLARTATGHPTIATDPFVPTVLWAGGYGGQGIAQGFALGRTAAERILTATYRRGNS